jgi:hypothetical protein
MVYWMSTQEVFENSTTTSFLDAQLNRVDYSMKGVRFLELDALDPVIKIFQNEESEPLTKGYAVEPDSVPKNLCWHSGNRHIPDVVKCAAASLLVSQKVRDIIDAIEPGVHQLLPVDVFRPKALKEGTGPFARCASGSTALIPCARRMSAWGATKTGCGDSVASPRIK